MKGDRKEGNVVMVTTLLPETHYSQYLCSALNKLSGGKLVVYADDDKENLEIKNCGKIKTVFKKNWKYVFDIAKQLRKDRPSLVHLQHEINMYGPATTAMLFPLAVVYLGITGHKVIVTIHAVPERKIIDQKFVKTFGYNLPAFLVRLFFSALFKLIAFGARKIIVHTSLQKDILQRDYGIRENKIQIINHGVPVNFQKTSTWQKSYPRYFLYFGHLVKRKGLERVINGFSGFVKKGDGSDFKLIFSGGTIKGQEFARDEILDLAEKLSLKEKFEYRGFVGEQDLNDLFEGAYAVLVPAEISISASGPLAQAWGCGKCVLASDVGNLRQEIKDGDHGILVDNEKWQEAFSQAAENPGLVKQIEKNAIKRAMERNWDNIAKQHLELYDEALLNK